MRLTIKTTVNYASELVNITGRASRINQASPAKP